MEFRLGICIIYGCNYVHGLQCDQRVWRGVANLTNGVLLLAALAAWLAEGPHRVVAQAPVHCATVHFSDLRGDFQCPTLCQRSILRQERLEKTWSDSDRLAGCARGIVLQVS